MRAVDLALHPRPEALNGVGVDEAAHVFLGGVIDRTVLYRLERPCLSAEFLV